MIYFFVSLFKMAELLHRFPKLDDREIKLIIDRMSPPEINYIDQKHRNFCFEFFRTYPSPSVDVFSYFLSHGFDTKLMVKGENILNVICSTKLSKNNHLEYLNLLFEKYPLVTEDELKIPLWDSLLRMVDMNNGKYIMELLDFVRRKGFGLDYPNDNGDNVFDLLMSLTRLRGDYYAPFFIYCRCFSIVKISPEKMAEFHPDSIEYYFLSNLS